MEGIILNKENISLLVDVLIVLEKKQKLRLECNPLVLGTYYNTFRLNDILKEMNNVIVDECEANHYDWS